jgi:hypothetical protein
MNNDTTITDNNLFSLFIHSPLGWNELIHSILIIRIPIWLCQLQEDP